MSNTKREVWVWETSDGELKQSALHRHRLPGIVIDGGVFRYVPEPPTSETAAFELLEQLVNLVGSSAPLSWVGADDQESAQDWEKQAKVLLDKAQVVLRRRSS